MTRPIDTSETASAGHVFDRQAAYAFLLYLSLSLLFFARGLGGNFSTYHLATGPDPAQSIWFLAWWAHAIVHHLNPLLPTVVFAPVGANLTWATDVPLVMLLAAPLTLTVGPIATYNALMLLAPALAGWGAFILCRYLARQWWPAWLGGWVFGFSPYVLGAMLSHLHVVQIFPIPLILWLVLRRLNGEIDPRRFVAGMVLLLVVQFGCFVESFATTAVFGAMALGLALLLIEGDMRGRLWSLIPPLAAAYALSAALLVPFLYYMFAYGAPHGVVFSSWDFSADLLSLVIPTPLNELGRLAPLAAIAAKFRTGLDEAGSYISLPLLVVATLYARTGWRTPAGRLVVDLLVIMCVLSMGPWLQIAGRITFGLPWLVLERLPLLEKALPGRFAIYVYLILAVMVAIWLSTSDATRPRKWLLGAGVVLLGLPNLNASYWVQAVGLPPLFTATAYSHYLAPGETVLVLPFGWQGDDMLLQASADMYFKLAGGYVGYAPLLPAEYAQWPIMQALYNVAGVPDGDQQLKAFLATHNVGAVIIGDRRYRLTKFYHGLTPDVPIRVTVGPIERRELREVGEWLGELHATPIEAGAFTLYPISAQALEPYRDLSALEMQRRAARGRFEALLVAAQRYIAAGRDPAALTPRRVEALGFVPLDWFGGEPFPTASPNPVFHTGAVLHASNDGTITVGIEGGYSALAPLIEQYKADADTVYFPYPMRFSPASNTPGDEVATMVMDFSRDGLARAAASAAASGAVGER
ncbi:MAG TPA: hypothetical protein VNE82_19625 [Candidatus Binataceae bacterium]|nr:hypothetical protein [Candidatus Binataceae bacterium]